MWTRHEDVVMKRSNQISDDKNVADVIHFNERKLINFKSLAPHE